MDYNNIIEMWKFTRAKFTEKIEKIDEADLTLKLDKASIGEIIYHTAEAEYIFADWFLGRKLNQPFPINITKDKSALLKFLQEANEDLITTMEILPKEKWTEKIPSKMGESTPAEAIGRLIYHAGIHAGQITIIQQQCKRTKN